MKDIILVGANIARRYKDNTFTGLNTFAGLRKGVVVKTTGYTATSNDNIIVCNSSSAMTITLPSATGSGQFFAISNVGSGQVTVQQSGGTINGETSQLVDQYATIQIIDYGTNLWTII